MGSINIWLHGKPAWYIGNEGGSLTSKEIRDAAEGVRQHLIEVADVLDKLQANGWSAATLCLYDFMLDNDAIKTEAELNAHLVAIGVNPELVSFMDTEDWDEEEGDEEEDTESDVEV